MEARSDSAPTPLTVRKQQESASPLAEVVTTRRDRRRKRTVEHTPANIRLTSDTDSQTTDIITVDSEKPYTETQLWAADYADTHLELFDPASNPAYLEEDKDTGEQVIAQKYLPLVDALEDLASNRTKLAELSVKLRNGTTLSNGKSRESSLNAVEQAYHEARIAVAENLLELNASQTLAKKQALLSVFDAREDGALMGEEANHYLNRQQTLYQRGLERYRGLSRKEKIALGIGGVAVVGLTGAVFGLVAGGAAAGATIGGRFGRKYFTSEADRKDTRSDTQRQEESTLRTSNREDFFASSASLDAAIYEEKRTQEKKNALFEAYFDQSQYNVLKSDEAYLAESKKESDAKRKSFYKAAGAVALGATIGAIVGLVAENATDWHGTARGSRIDLWPFDSDVDATDLRAQLEDMNEQVADMHEQIQDLTEQTPDTDIETSPTLPEGDGEVSQPDTSEPTPEAAPEVTSEISAEAEALYGEFAGETVSLDIPAGSNLWNQLELQVDEQNPYTTFEEKQRLVGNMLKVLQEQNPGRDLNLVHPGEHFEIVIPS